MIARHLDRLIVEGKDTGWLTVEVHLRGGSVITLDMPPKAFNELVTALICLVPSPGRGDRMEWEA